ncbi:uncharacterized protein B4U79_18331 [Dinothrombium tinctorium]|uniref:Uncharacterized protein n=1 Tax=Dinothrombium tinctorium TaxID=1965070 RepID=A0A3S3RV23_9ACAR|nr:uncharacterized protein B4U79_18331 [Dinothrombium tinctorium]
MVDGKLTKQIVEEQNIPSTRILNIDMITVKKSYQNSKVGRYMLERVKNQSLVGPYNVMTVLANINNFDFFIKCGFIEDTILCRKFKKALNIQCAFLNSSLLFYLPPFYDQYSLKVGNCFDTMSSNLSLKSMFYEIKRWKDRSLENYEEQICLILRLKKEICRLHGLLGKQEHTINTLAKQNQALQNLLAEIVWLINFIDWKTYQEN